MNNFGDSPFFTACILPRARHEAERLAGRAQVLLYSGFSLTQAALYSHNSGFLFFALPLCLIYAALRGEGRPDV